MTRLDFDASSVYQARCPRAADVSGILKLCQTFVAHDRSQGLGNATPFTGLITTRMTALETSLTNKTTGTIDFITAGGSLKQLDARAKLLARQARDTVSGYCAGQPTQGVQWGYGVRQTGRNAGQLLLPTTREEILKVFDVYLTKEASRPEAERFAFPRMEEVQSVRDALAQQLAARQQSGAVKEGSRAGSLVVAAELLDLVQAALAYLIVMRFNFKVTPDLQAWGFEVIERQGKTPEPPAEPGAPAEPTA